LQRFNERLGLWILLLAIAILCGLNPFAHTTIVIIWLVIFFML